MRIMKIEVENFRLLKKFSIDLETELSLIIGKNNTGKTSLLSVLDKFLGQNEKNKFSFDDFNLIFKNRLKKNIEYDEIIPFNDFPLGIKLKIFIGYDDKDNLANISNVMMDLDPDNNVVVLGFEYVLEENDFFKLKDDCKEFLRKETEKKELKDDYAIKDLFYFFQYRHQDYFKTHKKSFEYDKLNGVVNELNFINLKNENISTEDIINFKFISARRDVTNKEIDKTLSSQTSKIYRRTETTDEQSKAVEDFKDRLSETDTHLSKVYQSLFNNVVGKVKEFGGININESVIEIVSTLQHRELLEGNTTVIYKHDDSNLPEHYNGLGYMNLISMIFEIEILIHEFRRQKEKKPADINLLFIEEPEAHTHPQMQYIFIKNIKKLLNEGVIKNGKEKRKLQYVISTHSSHIVADSDFNDIKYLKRINSNNVISKNLKDLEKEYNEDGQEQNFRFLKQYLTLNRAELFFADKACFIEGDTERILLPAMMKKIDQEITDGIPLLSQNISIVEVGAHSKIFEKFIDFLGIKKSLIITDIDSHYLTPKLKPDKTEEVNAKGEVVLTYVKCPANHMAVKFTGNNSLIFFHGGKKNIEYFKELAIDWKILRKNKNNVWVSNRKGYLLLSYQIEENNYHARSFEDAFFHLNKDFIIETSNDFPSITPKYIKKYRNNEIDSFEFAEKAVGSKPSLAIEILLNSKTDLNKKEFSNWQIPAYIKEGLLWLKQG